MDGDASGRIKCTLANWTGGAYKIPRTDIDKCKEREDLKQSSVYFLFRKTDGEKTPVVYIGQVGARKNGEGILNLLQEHKRKLTIRKDGFTFANAVYLPEALRAIDQMPEDTLEEIVAKYVEMNVALPFMEGNGRSTRIWLDMMLKARLDRCVDWSRIDKREYLDAMRRSVSDADDITALIRNALTDETDDREVYMKGVNYPSLWTILTMVAEGETRQIISDHTGLSKSTVSNRYKRAQKTAQHMIEVEY